ncbi:hypothetical protein NQ317_009733 [Molorchus minor]|uniref:RHD domain-containing protein n=1 Tax=Molorchus minor TaxID=1323400 RepID=A0ABQ9JDG7_9CUCU|nr:hypothetical protein NQ317_009733 [Molorchus minor]
MIKYSKISKLVYDPHMILATSIPMHWLLKFTGSYTLKQEEHGMRDDSNLLSDVIEVIATDPDFRESTTQKNNKMFNGGGEITPPRPPQQLQQQSTQPHGRPYVRIIEQPASKALRFRYECEGRSAGSIPGSSSSPENKTFPKIEVVGYKGRAVVVVSCVTKDPPHKPHPHNLVGREGCKRGVCTLEIPADTMTVHFSNLGIQCVKKKDIEHALRVREEIRVDPFRNLTLEILPHPHKLVGREGCKNGIYQTTVTCDTVSLFQFTNLGIQCVTRRKLEASLKLREMLKIDPFQIFLEGEPGKFSRPLTPVVSETIYDKKGYVRSQHHQAVPLCCLRGRRQRRHNFTLREGGERRHPGAIFQENSDWEAYADFQPSQVHKQTGIWFKPPKYKTLDVTEPVKAFIQLRRPSDGCTSEPLPFQFLPLDSGRPPYWLYRRNYAKKANYNLFNTILANDAKLVAKRQLGNVPETNEQEQVLEKPVVTINLNEKPQEIVSTTSVPDPHGKWTENVDMETNNNQNNIENKEMDISAITNNNNLEQKSFNELINQVAELDEIYSSTQARLLSEALITDVEKPSLVNMTDESFDDAKTYSSLQLAFKNPIEIQFSDVIVKPPSPLIGPTLNTSNTNIYKRENEPEKLPPLPPKRTKKLETFIGGSMSSISFPNKCPENTLHRSNSSLRTPCVSRSQSFSLQRPKSQSELIPPGKRLPPTPNFSTLPNPKKRGFLSKLFGRKSKTPSNSREPSVTPSTKSTKSLMVNTNLTKSSGNISTHSASSIRIPLKDSPPNSNQNLSTIDDTALRALGIQTPMDITSDITDTEVEHYALYTTMAPRATESEFDEMSFYYAPVEGGKILTNAEVNISGKTGPRLKLYQGKKNGKNYIDSNDLPSNKEKAHTCCLGRKRKRRKIDDSKILNQLQERDSKGHFTMNIAMDAIKSEPRDSTPSPYGGLTPGYSGVSPGYVPILSPQQYNITSLRPTPSPDYQYAPQLGNLTITGDSPQPHMWHSPLTSSLPGTSSQPPLWNIPPTPGLHSMPPQTENLLLDLDSRELNINSDEIAETLKTIDPMPLPEIENLSFSDVVPQDVNMTDSLTRLANNTIDNL